MSHRGRNRHLPDGWLNYDPMKEVIKDIRIVPFKVPLPAREFSLNDMKSHKWTPSDVMHRIPDLGLVIDLTFKNPCYYQPLEFLENGVDWKKIGCPGHVLPPEDLFIEFCNTVDTFLREHPDLVVGVHCTHGVNRTGYMICRYMVERRGYTAKDALSTFAEKRGYPVERQNYTERISSSSRA